MVNDHFIRAAPKLISKLVICFVLEPFSVLFHVTILDYRDDTYTAPFTYSKLSNF